MLSSDCYNGDRVLNTLLNRHEGPITILSKERKECPFITKKQTTFKQIEQTVNIELELNPFVSYQILQRHLGIENALIRTCDHTIQINSPFSLC